MIIKTNTVDRAYASHKKTWGILHEDRVVDQCIEEMAELTQALMKRRRRQSRVTTLPVTEASSKSEEEAILGELVDVCLCLEFISRDLDFAREDFVKALNLVSSKLELKLVRLRRNEALGFV